MIYSDETEQDKKRIAIRYLIDQIEKTDDSNKLKRYFDQFNDLV